jgi:hypothetical protein
MGSELLVKLLYPCVHVVGIDAVLILAELWTSQLPGSVREGIPSGSTECSKVSNSETPLIQILDQVRQVPRVMTTLHSSTLIPEHRIIQSVIFQRGSPIIPAPYTQRKQFGQIRR